MEGPAATAIIRGLGIHWPIFGLTGCVFEADIMVFLEAGANKVLAKPLHLLDFKSAMDELLEPPALGKIDELTTRPNEK
jgi:hypothetical protein